MKLVKHHQRTKQRHRNYVQSFLSSVHSTPCMNYVTKTVPRLISLSASGKQLSDVYCTQPRPKKRTKTYIKELFEDMFDHRSYAQNFSSCEIQACK